MEEVHVEVKIFPAASARQDSRLGKDALRLKRILRKGDYIVDFFEVICLQGCDPRYGVIGLTSLQNWQRTGGHKQRFDLVPNTLVEG